MKGTPKLDFIKQMAVASLLAVAAISAPAQQPSSDEELIEPTRPTIANSASFQPAGILQIEYGYDGFYRADEFRSQHAGPLVLRFAAHERLLLEFDIDTFISPKDPTGNRSTERRLCPRGRDL